MCACVSVYVCSVSISPQPYSPQPYSPQSTPPSPAHPIPAHLNSPHPAQLTPPTHPPTQPYSPHPTPPSPTQPTQPYSPQPYSPQPYSAHPALLTPAGDPALVSHVLIPIVWGESDDCCVFRPSHGVRRLEQRDVRRGPRVVRGLWGQVTRHTDSPKFFTDTDIFSSLTFSYSQQSTQD